MKRGYIIYSAAAVMAMLLWWLWPRGAEPAHPQAAPDAVTLERVTPLPIDTRDTNTADEVEELEVPGSPLMTQMLRERREAFDRSFDDWRTPIEFFGLVVDENDQPVSGVAVTLGVTDLSPDGHTAYSLETDLNGHFFLGGVQGKHVSVQLSKPGYYVSRRQRVSFFYAGENENFVPNRLEPVVFRLRRHGPVEPLIGMVGGAPRWLIRIHEMNQNASPVRPVRNGDAPAAPPTRATRPADARRRWKRRPHRLFNPANPRPTVDRQPLGLG